MQAVMLPYLRPEMALYDVGCGEKPFADFLRGRVARHIGVDIDYGFYDSRHIDLVGSADDLPIEDGTADAILSSQVIEHLPDPEKSIAEAARVLKPGGLLFLSYPYLYPMHAVPHDFARLSEFALDGMLSRHGLELVERRALAGFWYLMGALTPIYIEGLPFMRALRLGRPLGWLARHWFRALHALEGAALRLMKKDVEAARAIWTVTYILVARRPTAA
ncbi:class I SAM-dependent methyltransferase [Brevundimonas sp.]|uniref:class I SAM-dependent methyltransferase n=1 Tax=Brevundimonas sp. TaxID=1871086 RepID=UPI00286CADEF|nr:class I SAM-dependent methyltransferase [Brevundimonas sp.]